MGIRGTIEPISSSGCSRWRRRGRAMCPSSVGRWTATPVTRLAWWPRWRRSPSSCGGDARRAAAVETLAEQLRTPEEEAPLFVADSGLYSFGHVARLRTAEGGRGRHV